MDRNVLNWLLVTVGFGIAMVGAPQSSDAAIRLGADGIWVPVAADSVESPSQTLDSTHKLSSFGGSIHGGIGFNLLSVGLKLNYFSNGMELEQEQTSGTADVRRNQVDINAMVRLGVPVTKLAFFAEGGASVSTNFDGVGYNAGLAAEYTLFSLPLIDFNAGLEGQYVNLPAVLNDTETDSNSGRLLLFVGADFGP